jgi:hypothetical protein
LVDELAAFGALIVGLKRGVKPRRLSLCSPNIEVVDGKAFEFDSKLEGDGYGVMANVIAKGGMVLNEMMTCPGISPFYGKVLSKVAPSANSTFLVKYDAMDRYFPSEWISTKSYAATSVPVEVRNTDKFKKASGLNTEKVRIVVATDYIPMLPSFMNFYNLLSGQDCVAATDGGSLLSITHLSIFRNNKAYRMESNAR